ncbi:MAG: hypothetical protein OSB14_05345 [Planctomycetota bacterium]|nr:hypothetical protein [Planctomycetota bacterium]
MQVVEQLKQTSPERFLEIYNALENKGFGPLDGEVAKAMKFRPQAIRKLPMAQRARRAQSILISDANAELTYELFGSYLMKTQKPLITDFLDETGVSHEDGMLEGDGDNEPDVAKLDAALKKLDATYKPDDVTLYLSICVEQWSQIPELETAWRTRIS